MATVVDWEAIADLMWEGKTVQQACKILWYDWSEVDKQMDIDQRSYLIDVSMMAGVKKEYLDGDII